MKKLLYLLALLLPLAGFTQDTRAFYGSSISRSYGVDTLAGFKAVNTNTLGYAGLVAISASDTSVFFTNGTGYASIYNSAGVLRQPQYVGIGGSPDVSGTAYLSLTGTTGGFLTARMTAAQKNAIGSPATGLLIYQTDGTPGFYYYTGSAWSAVGGGSSGITVGTTTITSGTTLRIPYNLAGVYQEQANFTIGSVASGVLDVPVGYASRGVKFANQYDTGLQLTIGYLSGLGATMVSNTFNANYAYNTLVGIGAGNAISGSYAGGNTALGYEALKATGGAGNPEVYSNTAIGFRALGTWGGGTGYNVALGYRAGYGTGNALRYATFLGFSAGDGSAFNSVIAIGANSTPTAANQCIIGATGAASGNGVIDNVYFNGVTHTSAAPVVINACGGSSANGALMTLQGGAGGGTNKNAGGLVLGSGISTGTGTGSVFISTPTPGSSGTGTNGLNTRLTIDHLSIAAALPIKLSGYTVATLPAGSIGMTAYVTDATAPTYLGALIGGGAVATPVFFNGSAWVSY